MNALQPLAKPDSQVEHALKSLSAELSINPDRLEHKLLQIPQVECRLVHRFGPGLYIRELHMPADTFAVGHIQRFPQFNMMLQGRVLMIDDQGNTKELVAPIQFTGPAGRKVGYVLEDVVWQNIYATTETDIDKLEARFVDKSQTWVACDAARKAIDHVAHKVDRDDFEDLMRTHGAHLGNMLPTPDGVFKMPQGFESIRVGDSAISGKGILTTNHIACTEVIAPLLIDGVFTPIAQYINHSKTPNAVLVQEANGNIYLLARQDISGCLGGGAGSEITIDYRDIDLRVIQPLLGDIL